MTTGLLIFSAACSLASLVLHALAASGNKTAAKIADDVDELEKTMAAPTAAIKAVAK
jgi:hypothetical protein